MWMSTNGFLRESLGGGRNIPVRSQYHRRGHNVTGGGGFSKINNGTDENLDLFSKNRRGLSVSSDESSDVSVKLGRLAVGSAKFARSGIDDLLSSTEGGKHDYDWYVGLIVPGETWFAKGSDCLGSPLTLDNQSPFSALIKDIVEWIGSLIEFCVLAFNEFKMEILTCFVLMLLRVADNFALLISNGFLPPLELLFLLHRKEVNQNQLQWLHEAVLWLDQLLLPRRFLGKNISSILEGIYCDNGMTQNQLWKFKPNSLSLYLSLSQLSVSQSESYHSSRPTRSSSVTRPSISSSQYSTYSSNRSSSILNTSSASVSSYTRPPSPITRTPPVARPSTPPARPTPSRSSTPSRVQPAPTSSSVDKTPPSQNSRPSTPSSRRQSPASFSAAPTRSNSRPSTPTRRNPAPSSSAASSPSTSAGRVLSNGRIPGPASRPSSPSPQVRPPQQPVIPPDFPLDTPSNLRTTLQGRPLSAGRSRTGVSSAMKGNPETMGSLNAPRRHSSPIVTRGRLTEPSGKGRVHSNGHVADTPEPRKVAHVSEVGIRRPGKSSSAASDSTGFGRTISKKSLDMAIRHMDIRNGTGSARSLSSTTLFPQSIRSTTPKSQSVRSRSTQESINNGNSQNGDVLDDEIHFSRAAEIGHEANDGRYSAKLSDADIYESSRYDAILLEDLKNTNWLHSVDDKSDQGPFFDNGSESLPEPFGQL
ncbi:hypothetical protein POTOM_025324 [Populus tomentosa]|uniref:Uncharacterized protein n=1 Tax=Populus tomentosa TaxID=118781 RepID=A0A8X7ZGY4_POPTO|nr:hypothetical protein POTOM_025324 [Populus tomentosa]